jgi:hypothetical protein
LWDLEVVEIIADVESSGVGLEFAVVEGVVCEISGPGAESVFGCIWIKPGQQWVIKRFVNR